VDREHILCGLGPDPLKVGEALRGRGSRRRVHVRAQPAPLRIDDEAVGRPDRAGAAYRALSKLVRYRVRAGGDALDDEASIEGAD
jgi:hypothetical protein